MLALVLLKLGKQLVQPVPLPLSITLFRVLLNRPYKN
nr:hypothetical protein Q903MT_gene5938 [Picea sitchensis]